MEYLLAFAAVIGVVALTRAYRNSGSGGQLPQRKWGIASEYEQQSDPCWAWIGYHRQRALPIEMICGPIPAGFDHDERALCVLPGIDLLETRAVRRTIRSGRGSYGGPTIRLARGLSFRFGGSGSTGTSESESFDELRQIDHGTLVLTTKRLAFLGEQRTNSTELDDLIGVHTFADSIRVHRERKQKAEHYQLSQRLVIPTEFGELTVVGPMIEYAIEMAKLNQEITALEATWPPRRGLTWEAVAVQQGLRAP
jgi:hypothetical protein